MSEVGVLADDGEPPSPSLDEVTSSFLRMLDEHSVYSGFSTGHNETRVTLHEQDIRVAVGKTASQLYRRLSLEEKRQLEDIVIGSMVEVAHWTVGSGHTDARALMGNQPLLFEPTAHAMMIGRGYEDDPLFIESDGITRFEQQRILLGGVAAFVWFLEK